MPIEIYASKFSAEPAERHETSDRMSVAAWLRANVPSFESREKAPISVTINGKVVSPDDWSSAEFAPADSVSICVEPKGNALETIFRPGPLAKLFGLGNPFAQVAPTTPKARPQGKDLSLVTAKGNQVSLNAVIPEIAGRFKRYPDYLLPAHRYFGAPREQWIEMLLCVGKGKYDIPASKILVGNTPIISLGADAQYQVFQPGANVSGDSASTWWHSASEVGSTSTGTAGLELKATYEVDPVPSANSYQLSGYTIAIPTGAGQYPGGWAAGMIVRVEANYPYTVIDGGASRDVIEGDFTQLGPFAGMQIEITGDNAGLYQIETYIPPVAPSTIGQITLSYVGGGAVTGLKIGAVSMGIGYAGLRYRITAAGQYSIAVERLTDTGASDTAWAGFAPLQSSAVVISLDASTQQGDWAGPFCACPSGETTNLIEWDVMFPGGLIHIGSKGQLIERSVTVEIQYRDFDAAGAWASTTKVIKQKTLDQVGFTFSQSLPAMMRPEVRMRRIGAKSTNTNIQDSVQWYGLRAKLQAPTSYEGVTVMAVRLRGGDRLASQSEALVSVEATRVLPVRNGGAWDVETPTRDIVPWIIHVAHSIGYTDEDLDMAELDRLHAIWTERGDYYDAAIETAGTVKQSLLEALQAGFADFTIDRGLIRPVRDEPRTVMEHPYTPQNMTKALTRQFSALKPDDFDGVDVEYTDGKTWQKETVECRLPGDAGIRVEKMKLDGVTGRTQAWRIGMRRRMEQKYRRWSYNFGTELDALNSRYLSYVPLQDDVPGYGQSALMLSYYDGIIESSEPFDWSAGGAHVVGIRRPDGTLSGPYAATRIDDYRLSISGLDFEPDTSWSIEPPHLLFGPVNRWSYPALITSISPRGTDGATVQAVNYAPEVYTYDDATPPA